MNEIKFKLPPMVEKVLAAEDRLTKNCAKGSKVPVRSRLSLVLERDGEGTPEVLDRRIAAELARHLLPAGEIAQAIRASRGNEHAADAETEKLARDELDKHCTRRGLSLDTFAHLLSNLRPDYFAKISGEIAAAKGDLVTVLTEVVDREQLALASGAADFAYADTFGASVFGQQLIYERPGTESESATLRGWNGKRWATATKGKGSAMGTHAYSTYRKFADANAALVDYFPETPGCFNPSDNRRAPTFVSARQFWKDEARSYQTTHVATRIVRARLSDPTIYRLSDDFDPDALLLNCPNGMVDLETGKIYPHDPSKLMRNITLAPFDPKAKFKLFDHLMNTSLPYFEQREYYARMLGLCLLGVPYKGFHLLYSHEKDSGKTQLVKFISNAMGTYSSGASHKLFLAAGRDQRGASEHTSATDIFLTKPRFVHAAEPDNRGNENGSNPWHWKGDVKLITGGDDGEGRQAGEKDRYTYSSIAKFVMSLNHDPATYRGEQSILERIFTFTVERTAKKDSRIHLLNMNARRNPGAFSAVLALGFAQVPDLIRNGFNAEVPKSMRQTEEDRTRRDVGECAPFLERFLREHCEVGDGNTCGRGELHERFLADPYFKANAPAVLEDKGEFFKNLYAYARTKSLPIRLRKNKITQSDGARVRVIEGVALKGEPSSMPEKSCL